MPHPVIAVVGCGFVGSIFTTEFLKLAFAGKLPQHYRFVDDDEIEERNCANQNFRMIDCGRPKAQAMADLVNENGKIGTYEQTRLDADNIDALLSDAVLIVDAVDNLATRQLLWGYAFRTNIPVLHIGISLEGTGRVEWTHPEHDTFHLAPPKIVGQTVVEPKSGVQPPCELVRMRGVGLNTSFAAALAAAIYLGFDPTSHLKGQPSLGWLTEWAATPFGHFAITETWSKVGYPHE